MCKRCRRRAGAQALVHVQRQAVDPRAHVHCRPRQPDRVGRQLHQRARINLASQLTGTSLGKVNVQPHSLRRPLCCRCRRHRGRHVHGQQRCRQLAYREAMLNGISAPLFFVSFPLRQAFLPQLFTILVSPQPNPPKNQGVKCEPGDRKIIGRWDGWSLTRVCSSSPALSLMRRARNRSSSTCRSESTRVRSCCRCSSSPQSA